ncbi:MAG TPA: DUF4397 domain-containing protein [Gemmatimonadaceae bacterium]|jgi:hypothetical protein
MRLLRFAPFALAGAVILGCKQDITGTNTDVPSLAYVRYVHAMPDTGEVDVHLVDAVENLNFGDPSTGYTPYRTVTQYTGIVPGARHFRVFTNMQSTDINVVSQVIFDTTLTLAASTYYTILHTGYARTGVTPHQHFVLLTDAPPAVTASQVAVRAIVATPGLGPVDLDKTADTTTAATLPASPTFANVAFGTPTAFSMFATGAAAFRAFNQGTTSPILAKVQAPAGAAQQALLDPVAGVTVGGTALTAFIFERGVAGSPNTKITTAGIVYGVDVRPPRQ